MMNAMLKLHIFLCGVMDTLIVLSIVMSIACAVMKHRMKKWEEEDSDGL